MRNIFILHTFKTIRLAKKTRKMTRD